MLSKDDFYKLISGIYGFSKLNHPNAFVINLYEDEQDYYLEDIYLRKIYIISSVFIFHFIKNDYSNYLRTDFKNNHLMNSIYETYNYLVDNNQLEHIHSILTNISLEIL